MADISFDVSAFRALCPEFASVSQYPDTTVEGYWGAAASYVSPTDYGWLSGDARARAINWMCAHLMKLADLAADGNAAGVVTQAAVDKVTVQLAPPPVRSQWQWWLCTTPYGAQLLALLQARAVGGLYVGGRPDAALFRGGR